MTVHEDPVHSEKPTGFIPKIGQRYWYVEGGSAVNIKPVLMWTINRGSFADFLRLRAGNSFRIRALAKETLDEWLKEYNQLARGI